MVEEAGIRHPVQYRRVLRGKGLRHIILIDKYGEHAVSVLFKRASQDDLLRTLEVDGRYTALGRQLRCRYRAGVLATQRPAQGVKAVVRVPYAD